MGRPTPVNYTDGRQRVTLRTSWTMTRADLEQIVAHLIICDYDPDDGFPEYEAEKLHKRIVRDLNEGGSTVQSDARDALEDDDNLRFWGPEMARVKRFAAHTVARVYGFADDAQDAAAA